MAPAVTVGGLPGTGTSTLCGLLRDRLGLRYEYAGALFREEAKKYGMDLAAFGAYCQAHPMVDQSLDDLQAGIIVEGDVIMEGRLAGWLARRHHLPAFAVWVTCDEDERVRRLVERDGGDPGQQREAMLEREASEADRYMRYYDADPNDPAHYDLVLDSTDTPPEVLADKVVEALRGAGHPVVDPSNPAPDQVK